MLRGFSLFLVNFNFQVYWKTGCNQISELLIVDVLTEVIVGREGGREGGGEGGEREASDCRQRSFTLLHIGDMSAYVQVRL